MDINDSELLELEKVNNWAAAQQQKMMNIDQFTKDLREKVNQCGFECEVKVFDTDQYGVYGFEIELNGRIGTAFDPDRQVHEVTNNLLELPGQDKGFIPSREYLDKLVNREKMKGHKH